MRRTVSPIVDLARVPAGITRADLAIAGGMLAWALLEALFADGPGTPTGRLLLAMAFSLPLAWRRRLPLAAFAVAAVARGAAEGLYEEGAMPVPSMLLASFSAALTPARAGRPGLRCRCRRSHLCSAASRPRRTTGNDAALALMSGGAWLAGRLIHRPAEQLEQTRARTPQVAREAVAAERAPIARELHDVVAHSTVRAPPAGGAAAARALRRADRARARGPRARRPRPLELRDRNELYLSTATVKTHVTRILAKLGLRDACRPSCSRTRAGSSSPVAPPETRC